MLPVPVPGKDVTKEIEKGAGAVLRLFQRLLRLSAAQEKHATLIEKQAAQIATQSAETAALRDELHTLKAP